MFIIGPELHIKTISSILFGISILQTCQTEWIYDLADYFSSKNQIFTGTQFSWYFDHCSHFI